MFKSRLIKFAFGLALALPVALPAKAQLDPRLQVTKTDFLDLYQQTNSSTLKPEVVTLFDFSGSTQALMYSPLFNNQDSGDNDPDYNRRMTFTLSGPSGGVYTPKASLTASKYDPANPGNPQKGNLTLNFVGLVRPDGSLVTQANVNTTVSSGLPGDSASPRASDIRNWMRAASHARFWATDPDNGNKRTIDIPLAWTILSAASTGYPLSPKTAQDLPVQAGTTHTGLTFTLDTNYTNTGSNAISGNSTSANAQVVGYHGNYVGWLFMGKDSTGKYFVPDAVASYPTVATLPNGTVNGPSPRTAFANNVPSSTRSQAVKEAAIRTWINYQDKVFWAYRFLNAGGEDQKGNSVYTDSRHSITGTNVFTNRVNGSDRGWILLNSNPTTGIRRLAALFPNNGTPLTYAAGNCYAQFNDPNSIFNDVETGTNKPLDCMKHFLILFTDGQPNGDTNGTNGGTPYDASPYLNADGHTGDASTGNGVIGGDTTQLDPDGNYWNIQTLSAVAAHGGDPNLSNTVRDPASVTYPSGTYSGSSNTNPSTIAPFWVQGRGTGLDKVNGTGKFSTPHPIQTMTVGLSLGGDITDPASGKGRLFQAAVFGDPSATSWDLNTSTPFQFTTPGDPNSAKTPNSAYFFDARDPQTLIDGLGAALRAATSPGGSGTAAAPVTPPVGLSLANQIYLGTFSAPKNGGPVWSGDLMMFATYTSLNSSTQADETKIVDSSGNAITIPDVTNAQWAASKIFINGGSDQKSWYSRKVWTRLPATATVPNPGLIRFLPSTTNPDGTTNTWGNNSAYAALKPYVGSSLLTDAQRNTLIDYELGANTAKTLPYPNRADIMGDIVNSAPVTLEYNLSTVASWGSLPGTLSAAASNPGARFRLVFVGDNQGYLHAFGEVSWPVQVTIPDPNSSSGGTLKINITHGVADELWAFLPTDFLANLSYLQDGTNAHRFMCDGTPYVYLLDKPAAGAISGNGKVDPGERALVIFGLRKGGRSYYALDVSNPFQPRLGPNDTNPAPGASSVIGGWAIRPDDAALIPASSTTSSAPLTTVQKVVGNMGFSSCQPFVGRAFYDGGAAATSIRDAIFLGGGFSTQDVDAQFLTSGKPTPLGRSALALDINTGQYLMAWDLTTTSFWRPTQPWLIGPVASGVVPFSLDLNSGLVSRAYFSDYGGNVWAIGSMQPSSVTGYSGFRVDNTTLDHWTKGGGAAITDPPAIRLVYSEQGIKTVASGTTINNNGNFSTLPAPFLLGNSPILRTTNPKVSPFTVGIALNTGDRNNPLDRSYDSTNLKPTNDKAFVIFDRQDSADGSIGLDATGITPANLKDLSTMTSADTTEGSGYFLNQSNVYGYYINYPVTGTAFVNKGIYDPVVLSNTMFFSYFNPTTSDPCTGGQGNTISSRICDVMHPPAGFTFTAAANTQPQCSSGVVGNWIGVATNFSPQNTYTVVQGGSVLTPGGANKTGLGLASYTGNPTQRFPRPRTWRVVR
ncbi:MAG: hypothetical protein JST05_01685 [Acidobacteria bacterium]|nr:hypothetical protein [Acidobacteriota bacterium]